MDHKAAAHLRVLQAHLGKQTVAALMVYTQLLKRMQVRTPRVFPATVSLEIY